MMTQPEIQNLLLRYRQGKCSEEEIRKIHHWYDQLAAESRLELEEGEEQMMEDRILDNLTQIIAREEAEEEPVFRRQWWRSSAFYSSVAAAAVLVIGYFFYTGKQQNSGPVYHKPIVFTTASKALIEISNTTSRDKDIRLEDGSLVTLAPGGKIIYPRDFSRGRREVELLGDAFFDIKKNPRKPFYVYSGHLITKVLGTSFRIRTKTNDQVVVEVVTGKVSVFENRETFSEPKNELTQMDNGVLLTPNQRVVYFTVSRHLVTGLVDIPVVVEPIKNTESLVFNNVLLPEITAGLEQEYGIEVVLANEEMERCAFTGDLTDLTLYDKLDLICKANRAVYEVKGTRILISGTGCEEYNAKRN